MTSGPTEVCWATSKTPRSVLQMLSARISQVVACNVPLKHAPIVPPVFAVDKVVCIKSAKSFTVWLSTYVENVTYKRLKDANFISSKGEKLRLEHLITNSS